MFEQHESTPAVNISLLWKTRVDGLATRLMIEGSGESAVEDLICLQKELQQHGNEPAARITDSLIAALAEDSTAGLALLLKSGLSELRSSLDTNQAQIPVPAPMSLADDAELVGDFLVEAREHLSQIEGQMLVLERDPAAMEVIHAVFRAFHTIKGLAGFLEFHTLQGVAHEVETVLDQARNQKLIIDSPIVDIVLESGDFLLSELDSIERSLAGSYPLVVADNRALLAKIRGLAAPSSTIDPERMFPAVLPVAANQNIFLPGEASPLLSPAIESTAVSSENVDPSAERTPEQLPAQIPQKPLSGSSPAPLTEQDQPSTLSAITLPKEQAKAPDASSVRVETAKLDHLMNMVGEIVIAQSLIRHNQLLASTADSRLMGDLSQLARVTAEVQRATMSMRMVPVGQLFQRVERVIRDLSRKAGKLVTLETSGTETEIDKTVAEELSDPLLHMVRNSIDHGIEPTSERTASGKSPEAKIRLSAYHQGGQVIIKISDDGRGLNAEKIRCKAEDRHLIPVNAKLTEEEIYQLIFEPGFSTAEKITDISGRGVGMDVVRRNVEKLRGRIETESSPGHGTAFLLKLPLTLAIIDGLVVEVGVEQYIIPLSGVREIFRPGKDALLTVQQRDEMMLVRDELMPVVRLSQRLGIDARATELSEGLIIVVESENRCYCLLVDDLLGKQEVVIKTLGEAFKDLAGISGCAVLGNGRVGLILDPDGIYRGRKR